MSESVPPPDHPAIDAHTHKGKHCPVAGKTHAWCPPQPGDSRSPCPALNTLANHGYIARDGKKLGLFDLVSGLKACYKLSTPLAVFLSIGGFVLLRRLSRLDLHDIGRHGRIEHDASLVHRDTPSGEPYAPIDINPELVEQLVADATTSGEDGEGPEAGDSRTLMDASDVARARVRREKESPPLDAVHAEIARGEMAIILGVWETRAGSRAGVPVEWIREWIGSERLPEGWTPTHVQGLKDVVKRAKSIRVAMDEQRLAEKVGKAEKVEAEKPTQL